MSVKFFGQFLLERGAVTGDQLRDALDLMAKEHVYLGMLAVQAGYLSEEDAYQINRKQSHIDMPFGELAIERGLLDVDQLNELMQRQLARNRNLGQMLETLDILPGKEIRRLWCAFKAEQAPFEGGDVHLPAELAGDPVARCVMSLFPKLCRRVARCEVRVARAVVPSKVPEQPLQASLRLRGKHSLDISLATDPPFATQLAAGASGLEIDDLGDELILDGLGEFLNVIAGSAMGQLEEQGIQLALEPPRYVPTVPEGFQFDLAITRGTGVLLLNPIDE